jgi:hypothetical protein
VITPDTFLLTEEHLKLLRAASLDWDPSEWGAPAISAKRPYGSGDLVESIARILGEKVPDEDEDEAAYSQWLDTRAPQLRALHRETLAALEIVLRFGPTPGEYSRPNAYHEWRQVVAQGATP